MDFILSLLIVMLAWGTPALAAESPPTRPAGELRLADALQRVMDANPRLQGHRFALAAGAARRDQAALRPPLQVGLEAENILGSSRLSAFDDTELTLSLATLIESGGKRERRVSIADEQQSLLRTTQDAERLDILAEVVRRYLALLKAQEQLSLAREATALAARGSELVQRRANAGAASAVEGANAKLRRLEVARDEQRAAADVGVAWSQLAATWGSDFDRPVPALENVFDLPATDDFSVLQAAVEKNPDILRFADERRVQEATLRLAEAGRAPDVSVSAGIRRLQAERSQAFVLSASIPLGSANRSRAFEAEARNQLSAVNFAEIARRNEVLGTLYSIHQQLLQKRAEIDNARREIIPLSQSAIKSAEDALQAGRASFLEVTNAQERAIALRAAAIDAAVSYHLLFLEIERLTGRSYAMPSASVDRR